VWADYDDDEEGEAARLASLKRPAAARRTSGFAHNLRPASLPALAPPPTLPLAAADAVDADSADAGEGGSELGAGGVRGSVLRALRDAIREGARHDVAANAAAVAAAAAAATAAAAASVDASRDLMLAARSAQERAEALVPKPEALRALARGIEAAIRAATTDVGSPAAAAAGEGSGIIDRGSGAEADLGEAYRTRARELIAALRRRGNAELRARVLAGELPPVAIACMSGAELAPPETRAADAAAVTEAIRRAFVIDDGLGVWTSAAPGTRCASCGVGGVESRPLAGARDIRKAEIWGSSGSGETLFSLRCGACQWTWTSAHG
jgi:hypothetical protein